MSQLTSSIGINISEENVQLVEILEKENSYCIDNLDEEFFEESLSSNSKEAKYIHILQNSFNEIILRKALNSDSIIITLPPSFFNVIELPSDKNLNNNDLNEYIKWELSKIYPTKKENYFSFDKLTIETSKSESYNRTLVFSIPSVFLKIIHKFAVRNNLKLRSIDNAHTAAVRFFINDFTNESKLSVYIEYGTFSYFLIEDSSITFEKTLKYKNISEITTFTQDVIDEITNRGLNRNEITGLILHGNFINDELKKNIINSLRIDLHEIDPFSKLSTNDNISDEFSTDQNRTRFLPAISAALRT